MKPYTVYVRVHAIDEPRLVEAAVDGVLGLLVAEGAATVQAICFAAEHPDLEVFRFLDVLVLDGLLPIDVCVRPAAAKSFSLKAAFNACLPW